MVFFGAMAEITAITAVLAIVSHIIQGKYIDRDKLKRQQEGMKEKQKRMKELAKRDDAKSRNEMESLQAEMLEQMREMMSGTSKVMLVSMLVFLPAIFVVSIAYAEDVIALPLELPWLANGFDLFDTSSWGVELYPETNWLGWYFLSYLVFSLGLNGLTKLRKKMVL